MMSTSYDLPVHRPMNVIIIGGSLSGLLSGLMLKRHGHHVRILDQNPQALQAQAAGISTAEPIPTYLGKFDRNQSTFAIPSSGIQVFDSSDRVQKYYPVPRAMNSWDAFYHRLRWNFDDLRSEYCPEETIEDEKDGKCQYINGQRLVDFEVSNEKGEAVVVHAESVETGETTKHAGDLLIGADGPNSTVRRLATRPGPAPERSYAGYVLWRGFANELEVSAQTREQFENNISILQGTGQYAAVYHIPGRNGSLAPGTRNLNFAWYTFESQDSLARILTDRHGAKHHWSVPLGAVSDEVWAEQLRAGDAALSPATRELMHAVDRPFLQVVSDARAERAAFHGGRVLLVGDALALLRPHAGTGVQQCVGHALELEKVVVGAAGIAEWEAECLAASRLYRLQALSWAYYYLGCGSGWGTLRSAFWEARYRLAVRWERVRRWWRWWTR